jgi:hypothetical protein
MFTKSIIAWATLLGISATALAATKHGEAPVQNVYNPRGAHVGSDPDLNVPFELWRDDEPLSPEATSDRPRRRHF